MRVGTPTVATHLLANPKAHLAPIGFLLRQSSLDELPQLWSILVGDMSFVGSRPALFNQHYLILLRTQKNVHILVPALTGWAQVNGRDELPRSPEGGIGHRILTAPCALSSGLKKILLKVSR